MNLVQMVMGYLLKGGTLAKISSMLGIGQDSAREATQAAVPAMLAGLSQVASTPDGARRLDAAIESADEHAADDPVAALAGGGHVAPVGGAGSFIVEREADPSSGAHDVTLPAHRLSAYAETAALADASGDPRVTALHTTLADLDRAVSVEAVEYAAERLDG